VTVSGPVGVVVRQGEEGVIESVVEGPVESDVDDVELVLEGKMEEVMDIVVGPRLCEAKAHRGKHWLQMRNEKEVPSPRFMAAQKNKSGVPIDRQSQGHSARPAAS
jgi:hypothetical protein